MKLLPVKKVINNITRPLNELIGNAFTKADTRRYFYNDCMWNANTRSYDATSNSNRTYTIPINGYYTIRAYNGDYGSYGKIIGKFYKGEVIRMNWTGTRILNITSSTRDIEEFWMFIAGGVAVTGTSNDYIGALGIGGYGRGIGNSFFSKDGYEATVRCNNGIAVGGGGGSNFASSYVADGVRGYNGGTAYAYGNNVYAIGGGAGAGSRNNRGLGGGAIVNDNMVTDTYNEARMNEGIYSCCGNPTTSYDTGGNGGCGGAGFVYEATSAIFNIDCGYGFFGDGGAGHGGSARSGSSGIGGYGSVLQTRGNGYFAGGDRTAEVNGGVGGFYGGTGGNGGIGIYGFGGNGNHGGDGQLMGGSGNYGGNGLKAGIGTISNGTAIRHKSIVHTVPAWNKTANDSIVIIEYGISKDNY